MSENDPIVGHKTMRGADGQSHHEPLRASEASIIMAAIEVAEKRRKELMPDEKSAIRMMSDALQRLKDLGWNDAIYCPKDGSHFQVIEAGSTGIHDCNYIGEWPNGSWWVNDEHDSYPSRPTLFRKYPADAPPQAQGQQQGEAQP